MPKNNTHPYVPSSGNIVQTFTQFRKAMPGSVDAARLKQLGVAPSNEPMVLGVLRFLGFIDENGNRTESGKTVFLKHDDAQFAKELEKHVKKAYSELFEVRGEDAWELDQETLIGFFRATDETSALTAKRQALTFKTLSALSGHGDVSSPRTKASGPRAKKDSIRITTKAEKSSAGRITNPTLHQESKSGESGSSSPMALTVRIEVNLPAQGDQQTYDRIFKSIRENLLNG